MLEIWFEACWRRTPIGSEVLLELGIGGYRPDWREFVQELRLRAPFRHSFSIALVV
jgi:hypothetical protein